MTRDQRPLNSTEMDSSLIYVYCILEDQPQFEWYQLNNGMDFMKVGDYYVAIKFVSPDEFTEENLKKNFANLSWIETNAREHIDIITSIMKYKTVIPFKFGTIFNSEESLEKFIEDYSLSLAENFEAIQGKEEWSVKVYCDKKALGKHIPEFSGDVRILEEQILKSSPGKAFLLKRKKAELIEQEVEKLMKINGQKCFDEYRKICQAVRVNNLLPRELTERDDDMILNATLFINKQNIKDFICTANLQQEKYQSLGFLFEVTGPWPPFSFVSIKEH